MRKFEHQSTNLAHQASEVKTLFISFPHGESAEAYMIEPQMLVQLAMQDISELQLGKSGNHLVIAAPGKPDILLLNFIPAATSDFPPVMQTLDGKKHTAQTLLDQLAFNESQKQIEDFNDITPAANVENYETPTDGSPQTSSGHVWMQTIADTLTSTEAYAQGKSITLNFKNKEQEVKLSKISNEFDATNSPEIILETEDGAQLNIQTQFKPVNLGDIQLDKIEHINMKNGEKDEIQLDLDTVLAISTDDQIRISGDRGDTLIADNFNTPGTITDGYQSFTNTATGAEILVELGLDFDQFS